MVQGSGTGADPWRLALIGPLELEAFAAGAKLHVGLAATTSVDTLGERCTVITTRFAARLATLDFAARSAALLPGVEAVLAARERGINPPRARLGLGGGASTARRPRRPAPRLVAGLTLHGGSERTESHARGRRLRRAVVLPWLLPTAA